MASLLDKIEFDRVKIVYSESNLNPWKNSHKMSKCVIESLKEFKTSTGSYKNKSTVVKQHKMSTKTE